MGTEGTTKWDDLRYMKICQKRVIGFGRDGEGESRLWLSWKVAIERVRF